MEKFIQDEFNVEPEFLPFIRGKIVKINDTRRSTNYEFGDPRGAKILFRQETNLTWKKRTAGEQYARSRRMVEYGFRTTRRRSLSK